MSRKPILHPVCGFIVRKLKLKINCPECCSQLESDISLSKFLNRKNRGGIN
jgi:predicted Zn-ribbon and HTH transcriptional regulator